MKAKYVIFGLLAPELIVFNGWRQRTVASSLVAGLRKDRGVKEPPSISWRLWRKLKSLPRDTYQGIKRLPKRLLGKLEDSKHKNGLPSIAEKDLWADVTLVHGLYFVMGGYAFDISKDGKPRIWPRGTDRLIPGPILILSCLISHDKDLRSVLPYLSEEEIWDKSKANGLAKLLSASKRHGSVSSV